MIDATLQDSFADADMDNRAAPGEVVIYTATINNTGTDPATGVNFSNTLDAVATLVPGSVHASPNAFDDSYDAIGNTLLEVGVAASGFPAVKAANGVLANDSAITDTFSIVSNTNPTKGTLDFNSNGTFTYTPNLNASGTDTFTYTIENDADTSLTSTATVTISIAEIVWYVDNSTTGTEDGRSNTPFDTFGEAATASSAGDIIFVHGTGTNYPSGITLKNNQQLIGEGVALVVGGKTLTTAGTRPVIAPGTGDGITLATGNTIRGLNIGNTPAADSAISGSNFGTATISDVAISGTGGAVDVSTGTAAMTFDSIASTSSSGTPGINLNSVGGSFTVSNPGAGLDTNITGADAGISISNSAGAATFSFGETSVTSNSNGGDGVNLSTNGGASFTFDSLDVTTGAGDGLQISSSGTVNIGATANTLNATGGAAVDAAGTATGAGWTFDGVTSSGSAGDGIHLNNMSGGGITVSGDVNVGAATAQGIQLNSHTVGFTVTGTTNLGAMTGNGGPDIDIDGAGNVTFGAVNIDNRGNSGIDIDATSGTIIFGATTVDNQGSSVTDAVTVDGSTAGSITFASVAIHNNSVNADGIELGGTAANAATVMVNGGSVNAINLGDGIRSTNTPLMVNFFAIAGTTGIGGDGIEIVNSDAVSRTVLIQNSNIFPIAGAGIGGRGIFVNSSGTGALIARLLSNQIQSANQAILTQDGGTAGSLILDLQNSTLTRTITGFTQEHVGSGLNSTIVRTWSAPNQVVGFPVGRGGILFNRVTFDSDANPGNGFQQVAFTGTLQIGQSAGRVAGDGLRFLAPTGDLSIGTLNISNNNGTGLKVDTKSAPGPTTFNLDTGAGTVDTTSGTAVNLDPLTGDVTLTRVDSANSPSEGIRIEDLAGSFTVTGDGANVSLGGNDSGGVIANTTGDGILLDDVDDVSLRSMTIGNTLTTAAGGPTDASNIEKDGIDATDVDGLTLQSVTIADTGDHGLNALRVTDLTVDDTLVLNTGGTAGDNPGGVGGQEEHGFNLDELRGDNFVRDSLFDAFNETGLELINTSGTVDLTVDDTTFQDNKATVGNAGEEAILIEAQGTATIVALITGTAGAGTKSIFDDIARQAIQAISLGTTSDLQLTVENSRFDETAAGDAVIIMNPDNSGSGNVTVKNNTFTDNTLGPFAVLAKNDSSGALDATIQGNTVTNMQLLNVNHDDIGSGGAANGTTRVLVGGTNMGEGNNVTVGSNNIAVDVIASESPATGTGPDLSFTAQNNTTSQPDNMFSFAAGLRIDVVNASRVNVNLTGNSFQGDPSVGGGSGIELKEQGTSVVGIQGFGGGAPGACAIVGSDPVSLFLDGLNPGSADASFVCSNVDNNIGSGTASLPTATTRPSAPLAALGADNKGAPVPTATLTKGGSSTNQIRSVSMAQNRLEREETAFHNPGSVAVAKSDWYDIFGGGFSLAKFTGSSSLLNEQDPVSESPQNEREAYGIQRINGFELRAGAAQSVSTAKSVWNVLVSIGSKILPTAFAEEGSVAPVRPSAPVAGETVNVGPFDLPAGKSVTIKFQATAPVFNSQPTMSTQGSISGTNFMPVVTDDPDTGAADDPTLTPLTLTPTAAGATVTGRAVSKSGRGLENVRVTIVGGDITEPLYTQTNAFGYFRFANIPVGESYVITVSSKRYEFASSTLLVNVEDDLVVPVFVGER